jgi:hypothetical protein
MLFCYAKDSTSIPLTITLNYPTVNEYSLFREDRKESIDRDIENERISEFNLKAGGIIGIMQRIINLKLYNKKSSF